VHTRSVFNRLRNDIEQSIVRNIAAMPQKQSDGRLHTTLSTMIYTVPKMGTNAQIKRATFVCCKSEQTIADATRVCGFTHKKKRRGKILYRRCPNGNRSENYSIDRCEQKERGERVQVSKKSKSACKC